MEVLGAGRKEGQNLARGCAWYKKLDRGNDSSGDGSRYGRSGSSEH